MDSQFQDAVRLHREGNIVGASRLYQDILKRNPRDIQALCSLAYCCFQTGQFEESQRLFGAALGMDPADVNALCIRGVALMHLRRWEEALGNFDSALSLRPDFIEALNNRATALLELKRPEQALAEFDHVLALKPGYADSWTNRGNALLVLERPEEALASYDRAISIDPGHMLAWNNRASALAAMKRLDEAVASYDKALGLSPSHVQAWLGRGEALLALWREKDALASYDRALALTGEALDLAWYGRSQALFRLGRYDEAIASSDKLLALNPDYPYAAGNRMFWLLCCCAWRHYEADRTKIAAGVRAGKRVVNPWTNVILSDSPADQLACARQWVADLPVAAPPPPRAREGGRIRVAYLSSDFRLHVTAHLTAGLFERHDRTRFETFGVSFGHDDKSEMRARLERAFDRFIDVREQSDEAIAELLRKEKIDIAIDLKGYTTESRPEIFARRAAPLQAAWLGYPGTLGTDAIDYLIADRTLITADTRSFYSEKIVYLPDSFFSYACTDEMAARMPSRGEAGLPEDGFVFCCFNNSYKLTPALFDIWMRLLKTVPGSVLWLLDSNAFATKNLREEAATRGIAPERLVFAPFLPIKEHRARYALADLFLDTLPCNAHTTAAEALWAGLPVLTCPGSTFAGRVAASLDKAAGLSELVVASLEGYEALALNLARDPAALAALKTKLARNRQTSSLFDPARLCRHLEAAYSAMIDAQLRGDLSDLAVPPADS